MTTLTTGTKLNTPRAHVAGADAGGGPKKLALPAIGILAVVLLVWVIGGLTGGVDPNAALDRVPVEAHSFAIALKQKGELQASNSTDIKCEVEGRSTIISLIAEGTAVKKGDLLVELASDEIENRIRQEELKEANAVTVYESSKTELEIQRDKNKSDIRKAALQIELKRIDLEKYQKGDWTQKYRDSEIAIEQAVMTLESRDEDFGAKKKLYEKNYTTKADYDEAKFDKQKAEWDLEKARHALVVLVKYTHVADLMKRESDLEEATKEHARVVKNAAAEEIKKVRQLDGKKKERDLIQDQLAKFRKQKVRCRIYSPTQGFVVYYTGGGRRWYMGSESQIKEGAQVIERQILMQLPDTSAMKVIVRIHEAKTNQLEVGQKALITVEGFPDQQFVGEVAKIAVVADSQSSWLNPDLKEYETEIRLDSTEVALKPGVTAHVEILVGTVDQKLSVPIQAVFSKGGNRYVFLDGGGEPEAVTVQLGGIGMEWAEIKSGVERGDRVYLAFTDEMKRLIPEPRRDQNGKWNGAPKGRKRGGGTPGQNAMRGARTGGGKRKAGGGGSSESAQAESSNAPQTGSAKSTAGSVTNHSSGTQ